jgi:hypothetical protein
VENHNFAAANFAHRFNEKSAISGYAIGSRVVNEIRNATELTYFENEVYTTENRNNSLNTDKNFFLGRLKFNHKASKKEQWLYDVNFKVTDCLFDDKLTSETASQFNEFATFSKSDDIYFNQFFEWHKSYSDTKITTLVVSHKHEDKIRTNDWDTNLPF